jgi:hypothetical protein
MSIEYPWYEVVNGEGGLMQGDFITECPIIIPPSELSDQVHFDVSVTNYDVIILSQSCDLENGKIGLVLLCPVWSLEDMAKRSNFLGSEKGKEELRRGNFTGYHLLNKCELEGFVTDYKVVDFRNIYSTSLDFLIDFTKEKSERIRLLPPYRENLSQAFARFIMRVGLPVDIPSFRS